MEPDDDDSLEAAWSDEYAQWCAEQDDEDEINRLLNKAADENK